MSRRPILHLVTNTPRDAFDPAVWLAEYQDNGGWYVATGGEIHLGWKVGDYRDDAAANRCRGMMAALTQPQRTRLKAHLLQQPGGA